MNTEEFLKNIDEWLEQNPNFWQTKDIKKYLHNENIINRITNTWLEQFGREAKTGEIYFSVCEILKDKEMKKPF